MGVWPSLGVPPLVHITPFSHESIGALMSTIASGLKDSGTSRTWPVANTAMYVPFGIYTPTLITQAWTYNGATASGSIDTGIYSSDGTRIVSMGSTAQAGTSTFQLFNITDTLLPPGLYFMAIAASATTTTFSSSNTWTTPQQKLLGIYEQATAFALPATATFATADNLTFMPCFGLTTRSFV